MSDDVRSLIRTQDRSYDQAGPGIRESYPRELAMDASRMASFLARKRYAVLATSRRDGRPQAAPIAFSVWKGAFWIATVEGARLRNLRTRPYASIVVMEGDERARHSAVMAEGPVIIHEGLAPLMPIRRLVRIGSIDMGLHPSGPQRHLNYGPNASSRSMEERNKIRPSRV